VHVPPIFTHYEFLSRLLLTVLETPSPDDPKIDPAPDVGTDKPKPLRKVNFDRQQKGSAPGM